MKNMKLLISSKRYNNIKLYSKQGIEVSAEKVKDTLNATAVKLNPEEKAEEKESLLRYHQENMKEVDLDNKKDD